MIDRDIDTAADRELHDRFLEVYKAHLSQVTLWPPMDLYELFWRLGRVDTEFIPGEGDERMTGLPSIPAP